jgi:hypothetical protein
VPHGQGKQLLEFVEPLFGLKEPAEQGCGFELDAGQKYPAVQTIGETDFAGQ